MTSRIGWFCAFVLLNILTSCSQDPNEQANRLFVEAQQLVERAQKQDSKEKLLTLLVAEEKLKTIVGKYPSANLAVQLASGQSVGAISLKSVASAVSDASWATCLDTPSRTCILKNALEIGYAIKNMGARATVLGLIAGTQAKLGLKGESTIALREVIKAAQSHEIEVERLWVLGYIASPLARAGFASELLQIAQSIKDDRKVRADAIAQVAAAQAEAGMTADAMEVAKSIEDASSRAYAVGVVLAEQGKVAEAMELVESAGFSGAFLLSAIAAAQARGNRHSEAAVTLARSITATQFMGEIGGDLLLQKLADIEARRGRVAETLLIARSIKRLEMRPPALLNVVAGQLRAGDVEKARQLAWTIPESLSRQTALIIVACAEGRISESLRQAQSTKDEAARANNLRYVAECLRS